MENTQTLEEIESIYGHDELAKRKRHQQMLQDHREAKERRRKHHRRPADVRREKYCGNLY